ncbi:MAG TPA: hypothetical protein VN281_23900 [Verrucomicrobiae bacterium]|nr:hypothetical protein [Verrucomicrobiae bacterium]
MNRWREMLARTERPEAHLLRLAVLAFVLLWPMTAQAHLGSPNVFFEGPAGPYPVRVTIFPPAVVPGLAQIHVRVHGGHPETVTVLPVRSDAGTKGAPPPDVAKLVPGETNLFSAQLWFMNSGAYSVFVDVTGPEGHGTAIVPMNSLAYERLGMSSRMSLLFLGLGLFLVILLVSVVGATVRESTLRPGAEPSRGRRDLAVLIMVFATSGIGGVLLFGNRWWNSVDRSFLSDELYRPMPLIPTLKTETNSTQQLIVKVTPYSRRGTSPLVPDHGQIMHLFVIRQQGDAFAHLHPVYDSKLEAASFRTRLPGLPAGTYQLYADITHENGLTETLTNVLNLAAPTTSPDPNQGLMSEDDAFDLAAPATPAPLELAGGFRLVPKFGPQVRANEETSLTFDAINDAGEPAPLEPYLGMYGHLLVQDADGSVFTHLHPLGSISMVAQRRFAEREHASYLANQPLDLLCAPPSRTLAFPYAFPKPGRYRLWLQVRLEGKVQTAAYSVTVD